METEVRRSNGTECIPVDPRGTAESPRKETGWVDGVDEEGANGESSDHIHRLRFMPCD